MAKKNLVDKPFSAKDNERRLNLPRISGAELVAFSDRWKNAVEELVEKIAEAASLGKLTRRGLMRLRLAAFDERDGDREQMLWLALYPEKTDIHASLEQGRQYTVARARRSRTRRIARALKAK